MAPILSSLKKCYRRRKRAGEPGLTVQVVPSTEQNGLEQIQSKLLNKLPIELRILIYQIVLEGRVHYLYPGATKPNHNYFEFSAESAAGSCWISTVKDHTPAETEAGPRYVETLTEEGSGPHFVFIQRAEQSIALLLTCR